MRLARDIGYFLTILRGVFKNILGLTLPIIDAQYKILLLSGGDVLWVV